jgi:hypothetical protein
MATGMLGVFREMIHYAARFSTADTFTAMVAAFSFVGGLVLLAKRDILWNQSDRSWVQFHHK